MSVFANKRKVHHKGDGYTQTAALPDVCKTPTPGGPVPIPYVNIAMDSDLANGTKDVKIEGNMVAHKAANLALSSGDEGGTAGGGILSNKIKGKMTWPQASLDVKYEGEGAVRFMEVGMFNGNQGNGLEPKLGEFTGTYPNLSGNEKCPQCGKRIKDHRNSFEIKQSATTTRQARALRNRLMNDPAAAAALSERGAMVGVMQVNCPGRAPVVLAAVSGNVARIPGFGAIASSLGMTPVGAPTPPQWAAQNPNHTQAPGSNQPGGCAAPRLVNHQQTWMPG